MTQQSNMEKIFIDGMYYKLPTQNAPAFVNGSLEFDVQKFTQFLNDHQNVGGFVKVDLKTAKSGKGYAELNTWKPTDKSFKQPEYKEKVVVDTSNEPCIDPMTGIDLNDNPPF